MPVMGLVDGKSLAVQKNSKYRAFAVFLAIGEELAAGGGGNFFGAGDKHCEYNGNRQDRRGREIWRLEVEGNL